MDLENRLFFSSARFSLSAASSAAATNLIVADVITQDVKSAFFWLRPLPFIARQLKNQTRWARVVERLFNQTSF